MIKDKRGTMGLNTAKVFMIAFLIMAALAIAIFLALSNLRDVAEDIDTSTTSATVVNETYTTFGSGGVGLAYSESQEYRSPVCTVDIIINNTNSSVVLTSANYTTSGVGGCTIVPASDSEYINAGVNISYGVTYKSPDTNLIVTNVTGALTNDFFDQTGTVFAILIVVVIMFAIGLIIYVVTRFSVGASGGGSGGMVGGGSGGGGFGSDTVTGI